MLRHFLVMPLHAWGGRNRYKETDREIPRSSLVQVRNDSKNR